MRGRAWFGRLKRRLSGCRGERRGRITPWALAALGGDGARHLLAHDLLDHARQVGCPAIGGSPAPAARRSPARAARRAGASAAGAGLAADGSAPGQARASPRVRVRLAEQPIGRLGLGGRLRRRARRRRPARGAASRSGAGSRRRLGAAAASGAAAALAVSPAGCGGGISGCVLAVSVLPGAAVSAALGAARRGRASCRRGDVRRLGRIVGAVRAAAGCSPRRRTAAAATRAATSGRDSLTSSAGAGARAASAACAGARRRPARRCSAPARGRRAGTTAGPCLRCAHRRAWPCRAARRRRLRRARAPAARAKSSSRAAPLVGPFSAPASLRGQRPSPSPAPLSAGRLRLGRRLAPAWRGAPRLARGVARRSSGQALADRRQDLLQALGPGRIWLAHTAPHSHAAAGVPVPKTRSDSGMTYALSAPALYSGGAARCTSARRRGRPVAAPVTRATGRARAIGAARPISPGSVVGRGGLERLAAAVGVGDVDVEPLAAHLAGSAPRGRTPAPPRPAPAR